MAVTFAQYVSSVPGRLVTRWDSPTSYLGARLASREEIAAGTEAILWETDKVIPLTAEFCARYCRELGKAVRFGDLVARTADDYAAWLAIEEEREAARLSTTTDLATVKG